MPQIPKLAYPPERDLCPQGPQPAGRRPLAGACLPPAGDDDLGARRGHRVLGTGQVRDGDLAPEGEVAFESEHGDVVDLVPAGLVARVDRDVVHADKLAAVGPVAAAGADLELGAGAGAGKFVVVVVAQGAVRGGEDLVPGDDDAAARVDAEVAVESLDAALDRHLVWELVHGGVGAADGSL